MSPDPDSPRAGEAPGGAGAPADAQTCKRLVRRLVEEVANAGDPAPLDEIADGPLAAAAHGWIGPFRDAFPDFRMEIVDMVAEQGKVAAHFRCSGTHRGTWRGHPPTGRSFSGVDEIYIFTVAGGRLHGAVAVEDNLGRLQQLGLVPGAGAAPGELT